VIPFREASAINYCGNGVVEVVEACDNGNNISCDGCSSTCESECSSICSLDESFVVLDGGTVTVEGSVTNSSTCTTCFYSELVSSGSAKMQILSSTAGSGLLLPGETHDFTVTVQPLSGVNGAKLHRLTLVNDGASYCEDRAFVCPVPTGEETLTAGLWNNSHYWYTQKLLPTTSDWWLTGTTRRKVKEVFTATNTIDICYDYYAPGAGNAPLYLRENVPSNAGGEWLVGASTAPSRWSPDAVGPDGERATFHQADVPSYNANQLTYLLGPDLLPGTGDDNPVPSGVCEVAWLQEMSIQCTNLPVGSDWLNYKNHYIGWDVTDPNTIGAERDSVHKSRAW
jgi:cysteine-rich repeat protein